jgi:hypothetical protein
VVPVDVLPLLAGAVTLVTVVEPLPVAGAVTLLVELLPLLIVVVDTLLTVVELPTELVPELVLVEEEPLLTLLVLLLTEVVLLTGGDVLPAGGVPDVTLVVTPLCEARLVPRPVA